MQNICEIRRNILLKSDKYTWGIIIHVSPPKKVTLNYVVYHKRNLLQHFL